MSNLAERSARAARAAVDAAVRDSYDRKRFTIERFGRHRDGYLHAQVKIDGTQVLYIHRRYGSWLVPGHIKGRTVLKEPEAALGSTMGTAVKYALADAATPFDTAARRERERQAEAAKTARQKEEAKDGNDTPSDADDGRVDDEAEPDPGVPEAGDRGDADEPVRA